MSGKIFLSYTINQSFPETMLNVVFFLYCTSFTTTVKTVNPITFTNYIFTRKTKLCTTFISNIL